MRFIPFPQRPVPIQEIPLKHPDIWLYIKREDLIHPTISGNKFWKLFYPVNDYLKKNTTNPQIITFGGAFSNHIAAVAAAGKLLHLPSTGIIRGDELENSWQQNPTLQLAYENGMKFRFVNRELYRNKEKLAAELKIEFPTALILPEGGTSGVAVEGVKYMLDKHTLEFDYICSAVGSGGTIAGLSKFAADGQRILGFKVVKDDSLQEKVARLSGRKNFSLVDAAGNGYGVADDVGISFINSFYENFRMPLDPVYTGKMMKNLLNLIDNNYFSRGARILAMHTGGLQGISAANQFLMKKNRQTIKFD